MLIVILFFDRTIGQNIRSWGADFAATIIDPLLMTIVYVALLIMDGTPPMRRSLRFEIPLNGSIDNRDSQPLHGSQFSQPQYPPISSQPYWSGPQELIGDNRHYVPPPGELSGEARNNHAVELPAPYPRAELGSPNSPVMSKGKWTI